MLQADATLIDTESEAADPPDRLKHRPQSFVPNPAAADYDDGTGLAEGRKTGYVLKVYPRFSETFIVTEILAREAAGEDIEIFSLRPPADPRFHAELARVQAPVHYLDKPYKLSDAWEVMALAGRTVEKFPELFAQALPGLSRAEPSEVWQAIDLAVRIKEQGIDHVHAHFGSLAARVAELASRFSGVPFSFTAHAKDIFHESVDTSQLRNLLQRAEHAVTISAYNQQYLRSAFPQETGRLHLVYNGLELDRFQFQSPEPVGSILRVAAVGRLVEKKGFANLIDATEVLTQAGHRLQVRIAGGGALAADLADRITAAGLTDVVTLLGPQPQHEIGSLLRWADVFAAPCVIGADGNADGIPTVLLEAMAMGVPTIASSVTGIPEVVQSGSTGLLIAPGSIPELVQALSAVAAPDFDRAGTAARARRLIERNFDSRNQARQLRSLSAGSLATADQGGNR